MKINTNCPLWSHLIKSEALKYSFVKYYCRSKSLLLMKMLQNSQPRAHLTIRIQQPRLCGSPIAKQFFPIFWPHRVIISGYGGLVSPKQGWSVF